MPHMTDILGRLETCVDLTVADHYGIGLQTWSQDAQQRHMRASPLMNCMDGWTPWFLPSFMVTTTMILVRQIGSGSGSKGANPWLQQGNIEYFLPYFHSPIIWTAVYERPIWWCTKVACAELSCVTGLTGRSKATKIVAWLSLGFPILSKNFGVYR